MAKRVKVYLELPGNVIIEQVHEDYSGRVISTTIEAELTLGELNQALNELENGLREFAWHNAQALREGRMEDLEYDANKKHLS